MVHPALPSLRGRTGEIPGRELGRCPEEVHSRKGNGSQGRSRAVCSSRDQKARLQGWGGANRERSRCEARPGLGISF